MPKTTEICNNVHWVGARHPDLTVFDELFPTHRGTTYNSYLIKGSDKVALIDTVKEMFSGEFIDKVSAIVPVEKIDIVVVNHTEPDHSGSLGALLDINPDITICCSRPGANFLQEFYERPLNIRIVSDGEEIDLGGKTLRFYMAPSLHWPDTMFTYLPEDALLFSCDAFGAHFCGPGLYNDEVGAFSSEFAFYYDSIMRPFKSKILEAVAKVEDLDISIVCPSHGPLLRKDPKGAIASYRKWSQIPENERPRALMLVLSPHGNTRTMGGVIAEVLEKEGIEVRIRSLVDTPDEEIRNELERTDLLFVGTPTINRDAPPPVWRALSLLSSVTPKGNLGAVFGSYGWSGEAVKLIEERLKGVKFKLATEGICFRFRPTEKDLETCREFARTTARALLDSQA